LPILSEVGFTATVFCAAAYVGGRCGWDRAPGIPDLEMMSWGDLGLLLDAGWEIGGHTASHAHLPRLTPDGIREEIASGRRMLEDRLARSIASFAYPYGEFDERCVAVAAEMGFDSAWTMIPTTNPPGCGLLTLGRFNCDRIRSEDPETAELALRTYVSGRYDVYALVTARRIRVRRRRPKGR
jgi:peptidoglycan/xylan/chitin deacetylase (PgdA/CDA1 family)